MIERAYAKINLALDVTGIREDGYHNIDSIFLPLEYYDELIIHKAEKMSFECNKTYIRFDDSNTIVKVINIFKDEYGIKDNFSIKLNKYIQSQAGLGGGSADAAACIRIFDRMYDLNLSEDKIQDICLRVGADVLFTYYNNPARVTGIGDNLEFFDVKDDYFVLLVKPHYGVSTRECYKLMDENEYPHPDVSKVKDALEKGTDFIPYIANSMEPAAIMLLNDVKKAKDDLLNSGAPFALMSGSGSTVFTMSKDENLIHSLYESLRGKGYYLRYTKVLKNHKK